MNQNRYNILKPLGKGPSGQTFLARTLDANLDANATQTRVVIKQLHQPQESLDVLTKRMRSVGQHPQLPALIDSWQSSEGQFLVFEYIAYPASSQVQTPPWLPDQVTRWLLSLLAVLEHLHSFRLVHGDIRPDNIRQADIRPDTIPNSLRPDPIPNPGPILVDLRITPPLDGQALNVMGGDAAYAAPEQALGNLVYASDLYSLGLVAIYLLTGLAPFDLYSVADNRWIWPELVTDPLPNNLSQVLHKLLARSLDHRYTSANQTITDLKKSPTLSLLDKARSFFPVTDSWPQTLQALAKNRSLSTSRPKLAGGSPKPTRQIPWHPLYQLTTGITTALALRGNTLAIGTSQGSLLMCDLAAGPDVYALKGRHRDRITALAFHLQGHTLYSACNDGTVKLWDLTTGKLTETLSQSGWQPTDLAIAPPYLIVSDGTGHITLWDLEQLTPCHSFNQHQDWVSAISASDQRLVSISCDRTLRLWSLSERRLLETLPIAPSRALALHPSGSHVIVGHDQGTIDVWHGPTLAAKDRLCNVGDGITTLALSPDARLLAVGTDGNILRVYEGASGQCVSELPQGWGVVAIAFDGHTLVSSSQDETVTIWQREKSLATDMT
ncbi:MAG: WD40 repeat domain-containing serine/threonine-protein kinase [Cyanobacteria bacterium P01_A01_bin.137]